MKWGGCWLFGLGILLIGIILCPVDANPLPVPITFHLYLEKNGIPYNENVEYSLVCYGHTSQKMPLGVKYIRDKTKDDPDPPQEVFHVSGTCPSYGCIGQSCQLWVPSSSEICILNNTMQNETFSVRNSSDVPAIRNFEQSADGYSQSFEIFFDIQSENQKSLKDRLPIGSSGTVRRPDTASTTPQITIDPSLHEGGMTYRTPAVTTARLGNPVESFWCRIVQFLGGRCE
jgi:hypothetical protein